jgi:cytochrome d ubiquinol oxidase subunit II
MQPTALQETWFLLIGVLWTGFFILEGFDFGVGMVLPFLGHDDTERRVVRATIAPVWDGNEVWLITAAAATFAAFPDWYATMFSAYYIPLLFLLAALILRAVSFEFRDKAAETRWRSAWDWIAATASLLAPLLIGIVFGGLIGGLPIDKQKEFTGGFGDLIQPYALYSGITYAGLCLFQGLVFLRLKTGGELRERASVAARYAGVLMIALLAGYVAWTQVVNGPDVIPNAGAWLALTFGVAAAFLAFEVGNRGWVFSCSVLTIAFTVVHFFTALYPNLMVSTTSSAFNLTATDSSSSYTLTLMSITALVMIPIIVLYQGWTYWVFRKRVTPADVRGPEKPATPAAVAAAGAAGAGPAS